MFCRNCGKDVVDTAEFCPQCGARPLAGNGFCNACGTQTTALSEMCTKCGTRLKGSAGPAAAPVYQPSSAPGVAPAAGVSPKSRLIATLLCAFLGTIGVHRFYVGKVGTGIAMIFTMGGLGIWTLIDFIMILIGKFQDNKGNLVINWNT